MSATLAVPHTVDPVVFRIDLSSVRYHLTQSSQAVMSPDEWPVAEREYRQFLTFMNRFPGRLLIPSGKALSIWQAHILDTRAYRTDCEDAFGRYLDHFPYLGELNPDDQPEYEIGVRNLQQLRQIHHFRSNSSTTSPEQPTSDFDSKCVVATTARHRVVLVALPWHQEGHQAMPLGHASILARLTADPLIDVRSVVHPVNAPGFSASRVAEEITNLVEEVPDQAAVVAIGAYVWNDHAVREIVKLLREGGFRGRIVLGGPQVTYMNTGLETLYPEVDAFIRGAGEEALCEYSRIDSPTPILGVHLAGTDDRITQAQTTLNALPSPWLVGTLDARTSTSVHWESQRGCPYSCSFCQHRQCDPKATIAKVDTHRAVAEIELLCNAEVKRISVLDPVFNIDETHATAILHRFIDCGFEGEISLQCRAERINLDNPAFLDAADKLNVTLEFGLQSVIEAEFRAVRRRNKIPKIAAVFHEVQRRGIRQEVSLIYGLPEQTLDSFRASVDWCLQHRISLVRAFPLLLLRGTKLHDRRADWQLVVRDEILPTVTSSSTFSESDWQAMDDIANALTWSATKEARPASVEQLMHEYREATFPSADSQLRALGRIQ